MKLNLLAMQALDFVFTSQGISLKPWYTDGHSFFSPKFTTVTDQLQSIVINGDVVHSSTKVLLASGRVPELFEALGYRLNGLNASAENPQELMQLLTDWLDVESTKPEAASTIYGPFATSGSTASVTYESGLVLHGVVLPDSKYELVGFEQN